MSTVPSVSVIVVSLDRPECLSLLIKSLEYLRYPNFEVIVVCEHGPMARPLSPLSIRWVEFDERNISVARNIGIAAAKGEILAFCDDDAVPEFGWLDALVAPFSNARVGSAGGYVRGRNGVDFQWQCVTFDRLGRDRKVTLDSSETRIFEPDPDACLKTVGTNCAFRRTALAKVGGFDAAYRFFLDETDLNLRLALAGWQSAMVPLAEVHHGFAAGPYRSRTRVPKSLFEIGASQAFFALHHGSKKAVSHRLDAFTQAQQRRLARFAHYGLLDHARYQSLLADLRAGFEDGMTRKSRPAVISAETTGFVPARPPREKPDRIVVVSKQLQRRQERRQARAAAAAGHEVTLIEPELSHRPLQVHFTEQGFWRHRLGLFGKSERDRPKPLSRTSARIEQEIARIAPQRQLQISRGSDE